MGPQEHTVSVREAAAVLRLSRATVYKLCDQNMLKHGRTVNVIRIFESSLKAYAEEHGRPHMGRGSLR
jgi:excisionase family DNA binding protein